jgi:hypothetical protein
MPCVRLDILEDSAYVAKVRPISELTTYFVSPLILLLSCRKIVEPTPKIFEPQRKLSFVTLAVLWHHAFGVHFFCQNGRSSTTQSSRSRFFLFRETSSNHSLSVSSIEKHVLSIFLNSYSIPPDICFMKTVKNGENNFESGYNHRRLLHILSDAAGRHLL